ncbi:MAG: 3'-5' exonuclease [Candidatus Dormibacteraceae bacterium]
MPAEEPVSGSGVILKARDEAPSPWQDREWAVPAATPDTPLRDAEYCAFDLETNGSTPFWVIEIGAERFSLARPLAFFDTLCDTSAPINVYARRRHGISPAMLRGAPSFEEARAAFLGFARGTALVEHSHDAFDSYLMGRGLAQPLAHPVFDTSSLARLVLDLPAGQTPGLARVVEELGLQVNPAHAALGDAQATAAVFRELIRRGMEQFGWQTLGDVLAVQQRPEVDRSAIALDAPNRGTAGARGANTGGGGRPRRRRRRPAPRRSERE